MSDGGAPPIRRTPKIGELIGLEVRCPECGEIASYDVDSLERKRACARCEEPFLLPSVVRYPDLNG